MQKKNTNQFWKSVNKKFDKSHKLVSAVDSLFAIVQCLLTIFLLPIFFFLRYLWKKLIQKRDPEDVLNNIESLLVEQIDTQKKLLRIISQYDLNNRQPTDNSNLSKKFSDGHVPRYSSEKYSDEQ
ncbi:hypothetical protein M0812_26678 [Anaeramoeba flamelloides]|uniref:Uncharacterized protein n=1 Tax=Anaeramoeba flamelloides TaxID=1746091 RepID=A0AAV7YEL5_9EUKA|nr:hypothetical protein M0812_26678 [Anaeramoeba flamelloides]